MFIPPPPTVFNPVPTHMHMHMHMHRHAQILGTLQAYSHWLCKLNLDSLRNQTPVPSYQETLRSLVMTLVDSVAPIIVEGMPEKVILPACQLLLSLANTVRPRFLTTLPAIQGLMGRAAEGKLTVLPSKVSRHQSQ